MIHEEICTYEVCKLAKEKGFDVPTDRYYHIYDDVIEAQNSLEMKGDGCADFYNSLNRCRCAAPTQSLLQRWLREEKKIYVCPCIISDYEDDYTPHIVYWSFIIVNTESGDSIYREYERVDDKRFDTYEQALEDAELYVLKNLL